MEFDLNTSKSVNSIEYIDLCNQCEVPRDFAKICWSRNLNYFFVSCFLCLGPDPALGTSHLGKLHFLFIIYSPAESAQRFELRFGKMP